MTTDWLLSETLAPHVEGDLLAPLYEAAACGVLALPFCGECSTPLDLDQQVCDGCGADEIAWRPVEPAGTVHSATRVHRREPGLVVAEEPYPVLDVELSSGHRLIMTTRTAPPGLPRIGDPVAVVFRELGGVSIPAAALTTPSTSEVTP